MWKVEKSVGGKEDKKLVKEWKEFCRHPVPMALWSALGFGVLVHLFGLVNILHNHDNIGVQPGGYGAGTSSGRWMLDCLGKVATTLGFDYNLPVVNGIVFLLCIAVAAAVIVAIFNIRNGLQAFLVGALLVSFPTVTTTLFYRFTTIYYGIAIIFSVMAVYVLDKCKWGVLWSALFSACALGIYQAYLPLTVTLIVLCLLRIALDEKMAWGKVLKACLKCAAALLLGLAVYALLLKVFLVVFHTQLSDYQGIDQMGSYTLLGLAKSAWRAFQACVLLPMNDYCGIASTPLLKILYGLLYVLSGAVLLWAGFTRIKAPVPAMVFLCGCGLIPVAVGFIEVMCPDAYIHSVMIYSFALLPVIPLVFLPYLPEKSRCAAWLRRGSLFLAAAILFCNGYYANVHDSSLYYTNRQVENYVNGIVTQVRMTEGFDTEKTWAMIGDLSDPLLNDRWSEANTYGATSSTSGFLETMSRMRWIENYLGYQVPLADDQTVAELEKSDVVSSMPLWPDQGSIRVVGEYVVIKFGETSESESSIPSE